MCIFFPQCVYLQLALRQRYSFVRLQGTRRSFVRMVMEYVEMLC